MEITREQILMHKNNKYYSNESADRILGIINYINANDEIVKSITKYKVEQFKKVMGKYFTIMLKEKFFQYSCDRKRYIVQKAVNPYSEKEDIEEYKKFLTEEQFEKFYYIDNITEDGVVPLNMTFEDFIQEYSGKEFTIYDNGGHPWKYKDVNLNEDDNCFYHICDEMQVWYNEDIRGIIKSILCSTKFSYSYREKEHFAYFWSFNGYEVEVIMDFIEDWFRDETEIKNIKLIKDAVKISGVGGTTLRELMNVD